MGISTLVKQYLIESAPGSFGDFEVWSVKLTIVINPKQVVVHLIISMTHIKEWYWYNTSDHLISAVYLNLKSLSASHSPADY